jgi:hypothetical protein
MNPRGVIMIQLLHEAAIGQVVSQNTLHISSVRKEL